VVPDDPSAPAATAGRALAAGAHPALAVAAVGAAEGDSGASTPAIATTGGDIGPVNPWAVGDAAVLRQFADHGRAGVGACP
jgi:hypothetical protein